MNGIKLIDKYSFCFAGVVLLFGWFLFFTQTDEFVSSFAAAVLAAGLAWIAYVLTRWLILALKPRNDNSRR